MKGKECWGVIAGRGTGSMVTLAFGDKFKSRYRSQNMLLSKDLRDFEGEFYLFIAEASWRLDTRATVVCGSGDSDDNDGPMVAGLNNLIGSRPVAISMFMPALDLRMEFSNGLQLKIFCCQTSEALEGLNYVVADRHHRLAVIERGKVLTSEREPPVGRDK